MQSLEFKQGRVALPSARRWGCDLRPSTFPVHWGQRTLPPATPFLGGLFKRWLVVFCLGISSVAILLAASPAEQRYDLQGRLRFARQIAREHNNKDLVARVEEANRQVSRAVEKADFTAADSVLREVELAVGIDPGGWAMNGQPVFHPTPDMETALKSLGEDLKNAMLKESPEAVRTVVEKMTTIMGAQAGVPDGRKPGTKAPAIRMDEAQAVALLVKALESEGSSLRRIEKAQPLPDQMLRLYAGIISGLCEARPAIAKNAASRLPEIDRIINGACQILINTQQPEGHFPFPDLRGKNIRFGDMTERLLKETGGTVKDGWLVTPVADGGTQFDTGLCGSALLEAGRLFKNDRWISAGRKAADWAMVQKCVPNFNYNAFSVTLLSRASRVTGEARYLEAALVKFRLGVAPGQVSNGRWVDPHNARTVYHHIIMRSLNDLLEVLPGSRIKEQEEVLAVQQKAINAVLVEFEAMGVTTYLLDELLRWQALAPTPMPKLKPTLDLAAGAIVAKCQQGERVRMGVPVTEMAALVRCYGGTSLGKH